MTRFAYPVSLDVEGKRAVVIGRYLEARSFGDMARHLGIREASVRSTLRHGLFNLRRRLAVDQSS